MKKSNKQPLVSIIVPVYNAADYLDRCLNSILQQTYHNIQLILVNDGSKDNSLEVCSKFAKQDARVIILDKKNSGVSDSRNKGIALAKGKYLQFVDSDDWLVPTATEKLVESAETHHCEMVIAPFYRVVGRLMTENGHIRKEEKISKKDFAMYLMKAPANFYYGVMWNKLYRRDLILKNGIKCDTELNWCEDFVFNLQYFAYTEQIFVLQTPVYYYVKRKDSLVGTEMRNNNIYEIKKKVYQYYREFYEKLGLYEEHKGIINGFMLAVTMDSLFRLPTGILGKDDEEIFFEQIWKQKITRSGRTSLDSVLKKEERDCTIAK